MRSEIFSNAWRAAVVGVLLCVLGLPPASSQVGGGGGVGGLPAQMRVACSLGVNTAPGASCGYIRAGGTSPELDLNRTTGTASRWEFYLPAASTDLRLYANGADRFTLTNAGALTVASSSIGGVANTDYARLSVANTFTAQQTVTPNSNYGLVINEASGNSQSTIRLLDNGTEGVYLGMLGANDQLCTGGLAGDFCIRVAVGDRIIASADAGASITDLTPSSGTFTASYTNGCTTTPTQSIRWVKIGNLVTMTAAAALSCTADTTVFDTDSTDIPAAIRPTTSNVYSAKFGANNNSTSVSAMIELQGGEIIVNRCDAVTGTCDGGAWTGSGTRGLDAWTLSYIL